MKHSQFVRLFPFSKGSRASFLFAFLFALLSIVVRYFTPQVIRVTVDSVIGAEPFELPAFLMQWIAGVGGRDALRGQLLFCAFFAVAFAFFSGLFSYFSNYLTAKSSETTVMRLRNRLFDHVQRLPYCWHNGHQTGDIIQRCTSDVEMIRGFLSDQLLELVRILFLIIYSLFLMFSIHVKLSLIALVSVPITILYSALFFRKIGARFRAADEAEGALTAMVQENATGARVVRAFGREQFETEQFEQKIGHFTGMWIRLGKLLGLYWGIGDFFSALQLTAVMIAGCIAAVNHTLTLGAFLAFMSYNTMMVWPVRSLGRILSELSKAEISAERLCELLDAKVEEDPPDALEPEIKGKITFEKVSFGYEENQEVLHDISFTVPAGSTLGILGATGSGKSTLVHLLDRLYELAPGKGRILIDNIDIRRIKRNWLRRHIGIVLQEPYLFSKSFTESIAECAVTPDLEEVRHYACLAQIDDAILGFAKGYETLLGERGVTISGGQKQRVAIARMLLQEAPIQIFDDSFSSVDAETDARIRQAIQTQVKGTVILIAHRVATLMHADQILVLDRGRILEQGTHQELISLENGLYRRIYDSQRLAEGEVENGGL